MINYTKSKRAMLANQLSKTHLLDIAIFVPSLQSQSSPIGERAEENRKRRALLDESLLNHKKKKLEKKVGL